MSTSPGDDALRITAVDQRPHRFGHLGGCLEPLAGPLGSHPLHDGRHGNRNIATDALDRRNRLVCMGHNLLHEGVVLWPGERRLTGQQEVERAAQGVDVGAGIRRPRPGPAPGR